MLIAIGLRRFTLGHCGIRGAVRGVSTGVAFFLVWEIWAMPSTHSTDEIVVWIAMVLGWLCFSIIRAMRMWRGVPDKP